MPNPPYQADNGPMTEYQAQSLFDQAAQLAHQTFADPSDEHVLGVYSRLLWNWQRGLGDVGATTLH